MTAECVLGYSGEGSGWHAPTCLCMHTERLAAANLEGLSLEEVADTNTEILKRVEYLNDYGGIATESSSQSFTNTSMQAYS